MKPPSIYLSVYLSFYVSMFLARNNTNYCLICLSFIDLIADLAFDSFSIGGTFKTIR